MSSVEYITGTTLENLALTLGIHSFYASSQALRRCIKADEPTQVMTTPNPCQTQVIFPCQMFEIVRGGCSFSGPRGGTRR